MEARRLLWRSKAFLGLGAVNGGYQRVDSVITLTVGGARAAGVYASAYRLLGPFELMEVGFAQVFYPRLSALKAGSREWEVLRRRGARLYCTLALPIAALVFAIMPLLVVGLFGSSFRSAVTPARILILSLVPGTLYLPDAMALAASERETTILYLFLTSTIVDIILLLLLAPSLGAAGVAWAWVATETVLFVGVRVAVRSEGRVRQRPLPDRGEAAD
jgi:O-antigen/teichoic acid export membrane protein